VRIGASRATSARYSLDDVEAALEWLEAAA